jgi:hypothetical protein
VFVTTFRVGMVFVGVAVHLMIELPILPYDVWSSQKVCFLKGVQHEEIKFKIFTGALLVEGVAEKKKREFLCCETTRFHAVLHTLTRASGENVFIIRYRTENCRVSCVFAFFTRSLPQERTLIYTPGNTAIGAEYSAF